MQALRGNMKLVFLGIILMAFNANANANPAPGPVWVPKADDKKKAERSTVPERVTRPKATPESLPLPLEKNKPAGGEKPKPAAK